MSRSYRKPCDKERSPKHNRWYNQVYRTNWKRITRGILTDTDCENVCYPDENTMVSQWDICDRNWCFIGKSLGSWHDDWRKRLTRK